jgi:hypothetical protein
MAVALAVLAMASALSAQTISAQTSQPTKTPRRLGAPARTHAAHRTAQYAGAGNQSSGHAILNPARRRLTPDEAGRAAGLAILRQRAGARLPRRLVRTVRRRSTRSVRLERASWRSEEGRPTRDAETSDATDDYSAPESGQAEPDERMAPSDDAGNAAVRNAGGATVDGDETSAAVPRESGEAAAPTGARTKSAIASLVIPRSGMPASLRGSLASLERQNDRLEAEGLERIEDEADLAARIADKLLVPIPISNALTVNPDLEENHRYCRPWTAKFLADLAKAHDATFHRSIEVSSAVRTVEYQRKLMRTNGNAAPAEGDLVSPHLTGATVDIAKKGLSRAEMAWMRKQLASLESTGKIDVEEEFKQACFHITVYKSYAPAENMGPATPTKPVVSRRRTAEPVVEAQGE